MLYRSALKLSLLAAAWSAANTASAQTSWAGAWRAGATSVQAEVSEWGADCGPRPESTSLPSPGDVRITQDGDHLTVFTRPQLNTQSCWSENPAVRKVSGSVQAGTWKVICRTPEDDPRGEVGTYTLRSVGDNALETKDVSRFNWRLNASQCVAVVTTTQRFERIAAATTPTPVVPTPAPVTPPTPPAEPVLAACTFGTATTLELRPSPASIELGERICVRALAVDSAGCKQLARGTTWELKDSQGNKSPAADGCFTLSVVGAYTLSAQTGPLREQIRFVGKVPDYSTLRAAEKPLDAGVAAIATPTRTSGSTAGSATPNANGRGVPIGILAAAAFALLAALGLAVLLVILRMKRRVANLTQSPPPAITQSTQITTPSALAAPLQDYGDNMDTIIAAPRKDMSLRPPAEPAPDLDLAATQDRICPTCRRGFGLDSTFCPHDGATLITYAAFREAATAELTCPHCGLKYAAGTRFCGKDGTALSSS